MNIASSPTLSVVCASCHVAVHTPPCDSHDAAADYLDALGWTDLDGHSHCPNCASYGDTP